MTGIERLRELANGVNCSVWACTDTHYCTGHDLSKDNKGGRMRDVLNDIADQIEREHAEDCFRMGERAADVSMSAYDLLPQEERDAIAWVREHGGLDAMVELSSRLMTVDALRAAIEETCTRIGVEHTGDLTQDAQAIWREIGSLRSRLKESVPRAAYERHLARRQRQIDESHAALRRRNERIGFLVSELNRANHENHEEFMRRAGDYTAFTDEMCKRLASELRYVEGCSKDVMDAALDALDRRLMPEGMEWLVEAWPRFEDGEPVRFGEEAMGFTHKPPFVVDHITIFGGGEATVCAEADDDSGKVENFVRVFPGERVKRTVPKVLDADGAEIRVGDTVWATNGHGPFEVTRIVNADRLRVICDDEKNGHLNVYPESLTHRAPVLAADGRPLREGETVYHIANGVAYVVREVRKHSVVVEPKCGGRLADCSVDYLTHERPDSWKRLEDDATLAPVAYCHDRDLACACDPDPDAATYIEAMASDLVRRAKALAERDA